MLFHNSLKALTLCKSFRFKYDVLWSQWRWTFTRIVQVKMGQGRNRV